MKRILSLFFALLLAISSGVQACRTGETAPAFTDVPVREKEAVVLPAPELLPFDLVVSPDGDDGADGSLASPLRTIGEAKARLRAYKAAGTDCGVVHVWLRGGVYAPQDTLTFDADDLDGVEYCAYAGEQALVSGGEAICGGWETVRVNGVSAWRRSVSADFTALYRMDGQAVRRTRVPESGYFHVKDECRDGALYTPENTPWQGYMLGECAFVADKADLDALQSYRNPTDVLVRLMHYWKDEMLPVRRYDAASGTLYSTKYCSMSPHKGDRYFLENVFEALDTPGEWYLDRVAMQLYYVPYETDSPETTTLYAGRTEQLIRIDGVKDITFTGITFCNTGWHPLRPDELADFVPGIEHPQAAYSTPGCITVSNASGVRFDACTFRNIGLTAVRLSVGAQDCAVTRCLFRNIGGSAVYIGGENADNAQTVRDIAVEDNHILQYGRCWANAIGVLVTHGKRITIAHNEIHDGFYTAVSVGWVWGYADNVTDGNRIEYNRIYDVGQGWLSDMGGIYTLGVQPHTVIRGNVISNVAADPGEGGYGGWGIYLDEGSSGILVEQNLVYDCGSQGFHQHYGRENILRNNIFAMNRMGQLRITRSEEHVSCIFECNIVLGADTAMWTAVGGQRVTEDGNFYYDTLRGRFVRSTTQADPAGTIPPGKVLRTQAMRLRGHYTNASFYDPWFRDAAQFDFALADNSFAVQNGFVPWDYTLAGTRWRLAE